MPAGDMAEIAREAPLFAQVQIVGVKPGEATDDGGHLARVEGTVVRVFAGGSEWLGRSVTCLVPVLLEGDAPAPSGTLWSRWPELQATRVLEAVLAPAGGGEGGSLEVVLGMCTRLEAPTDAPVDDPRSWADGSSSGTAPGSGLWANVLLVLFVGAGLAGLAWALWHLLR